MAVMRLLQIYLLLWFILYSHSVILEMKFVKGRYLSHYGAFKFNVPTMYQCAELCQVLDVYQSITFDKSLQQCKFNSITWDVDTLTTNSNFSYAEKTNIPVENPTGCGTSPCGEQEMCVDHSTSYGCYPFYKCIDGLVDTTICEKWANIGACEGENRELNITQRIGDYLKMQCKKTCNKCVENF